MAADIGDGRQALRVKAGSISRVAAGVAVKLEEVGELNPDTLAGANAVVSAITGVAALQVHVHRIVSVGHGIRDHLANLREDR